MPVAPSIDQHRVDRISKRVHELVQMNQDQIPNRSKTRDIMNGGRAGISRLVGKDVNPDASDLIPVANLMLKANERNGQRLGTRPECVVDPPMDDDRESAAKRAEKKARIVDSWDECSDLEAQLPQVGRWLPGYGFWAWTVKIASDPYTGNPYPHVELRDPYHTFPGHFGPSQDPVDVAFKHVIPRDRLLEMYPSLGTKLGPNRPRESSATDHLPRSMGGVLLGSSGTSTGTPSSANQSGEGIEVWEYHDIYGCWWVIPNAKELLAYVPNPCSRPLFVVGKRYAFDVLQGQYDQMIGLLANHARLIVLQTMAIEDSINSETNVVGQLTSGKYVRGRRATNYFTQGSTVVKMNDRVAFESFQAIDRIERAARAMATYPVTDDAVSPNSFVTGLGLEELQGSVNAENKENMGVIRRALVKVDAVRLELADLLFGSDEYQMEGTRKGAGFVEKYRASTAINGNYRTRRVYGLMAGWDEPNMIIGGASLNQLKILSRRTFRENIDGIENAQREEEFVEQEDMKDLLLGIVSMGVQSADPRMVKAALEFLPESKEKKILAAALEPEEEEQPALPAGPVGPMPSAAQVLSRMSTGGEPQAGLQTVTRG